MQVNGEQVFSATETAAKLGIAPATLKKQRQKGRITGQQIGRDYVYSAAAIRTYQQEIQQRAGRRSAAGRG
jgi:hypothetical protein